MRKYKMNNRILHILNMPAKAPEPALSITPESINGIRNLSSFDRRPYYDENLIQGRNIANQCRELFSNARLPEFIASRGLPAVDPLRMWYQKIVFECVCLVDLLRRMDNLINKMRPERIEYYGKHCWRAAAIQSLCDTHAISFRPHQPHRIKIKSRVRTFKSRFLDICYWMNNRLRCQKHVKADFLFFLVGASRFSLGLLSVLKALPGTVRIIDSRYNRLKYDEHWRVLCLQGEYPILRRRANSLEAELHKYVINIFNGSDIAWQSVPLGEVAGLLVVNALSGIVAEIQAAYTILNRNPDAIVVGTPNSEPLLEVARAIGRLVVVHTVIVDDYQWFLPGSGQYIVSSNAHAEYMMNIGLSEQDIKVCGNPFYDQFQNIKLIEKGQQLRGKLGIPDDGVVVLFAEEYPDPPFIALEEWEDRMSEIYKGLSMVQDVIIIVKLHFAPNYGLHNRENMHRRMAGDAGISMDRLYILRDILISPIINACDLMVMTISTTGEEAILLDKPLISFAYIALENFKYANYGAALAVRNSLELADAIHGILQDLEVRQKLAEGRARYRKTYFHAQDGYVAERIIKVLEDNRSRYLMKRGYLKY